MGYNRPDGRVLDVPAYWRGTLAKVAVIGSANSLHLIGAETSTVTPRCLRFGCRGFSASRDKKRQLKNK